MSEEKSLFPTIAREQNLRETQPLMTRIWAMSNPLTFTRIWNWGMKIVREELHGNNWLKVVFDKGFRYFYTILVFNLMGYALEVWSPPLFFVGASMPIVDLIAFRVIDRVRKEKK